MTLPTPDRRPGGAPGLRRVELGSRDLERSADFYRLLGFDEVPWRPTGDRRSRAFVSGSVLVHVTEAAGETGHPGGWANDDLQDGVRHIGMKVGDVDRAIRRLAAAGVTVVSQPADVLGDVRIAFFLDPDGARLEFIQGNLAYQRVVSPALASAEAATRPAPDERPRFDHVAITVPDLPAALRFWRDERGFEVIGEIRHHDDPRGFLMTYLQAGPAVLELFSFDVPVRGRDHPGDVTDLLGFRGLALVAEDAAAHSSLNAVTASGGVPVTLEGSP